MKMQKLLPLFVLAVLSAPALAQPDAARAQLRERMRQATVKRVVERLGLDAVTAQRLDQVEKSFDDQIAAVQEANGKVRRELRRLTEGPQPQAADNVQINQLCDRILNGRATMQRLELQRLAEMRKILRPVDFARLLIVMPQINREIKGDIYRALGPGGANRPPDDE
jgi:hypothetical protein